MTQDRSPRPDENPETATAVLKHLMDGADIPSFRALARQAAVSNWSVEQLRRDRITTMRIDILQKLASALGISLSELLYQFGRNGEARPVPESRVNAQAAELQGRIVALEGEYQRLQTQLDHQATVLQQQFQKQALLALESWLVQWPTVTHAVEKNPELPASRLVPLVQPVQNLLAQWNVEAIASVGDEIPFDPQHHQLMDGTAAPGDLVKVRYTGFRQGDTLLHRAKVSPVG